MAEKIDIYNQSLDTAKKYFLNHFPEKESKKVFDYIEQASIGKINKGICLSQSRLIRILSFMIIYLYLLQY